MSVSSYRLGSSSLFVRANEDSIEPKRVVFLSTEGTKTEVQYLHFIEQYRVQLGINARKILLLAIYCMRKLVRERQFRQIILKNIICQM